MDFSTPYVKQVSDFFMYLYQDLNRCPLTIDGSRTAIVDTLGPTGLHISQSSDLNRLLSSFHRDCPKSSRNLPKWNLSVQILLTAFCLLRLRVLLFGEIKRYKSPIRIRILLFSMSSQKHPLSL